MDRGRPGIERGQLASLTQPGSDSPLSAGVISHATVKSCGRNETFKRSVLPLRKTGGTG